MNTNKVHSKVAGVRASALTGNDGMTWVSAVAVPDAGNRPFAAYCHAHDVMARTRFLTDAIDYMTHPEDFCSGCRDAVLARMDADESRDMGAIIESMRNSA